MEQPGPANNKFEKSLQLIKNSFIHVSRKKLFPHSRIIFPVFNYPFNLSHGNFHYQNHQKKFL